MQTWLIALISGSILVNVLVWVFLWARRAGSVNTRLNYIEKWVGDPPVLPQCSELFQEIKGALGNVTGKVEAILGLMQESQKNSEKKHISKRRRKDAQ